MSPRLLWLSLLLLPACDAARGAAGIWAGECAIDGSNPADDPFVVEFVLDITEEERGILEGEGSFFYKDRDFSGEVEGSRYGDELDLFLDGEDDHHSTRLEVYGLIRDDTVTGGCTFYGVDGALTMARSDDAEVVADEDDDDGEHNGR